MKYSGIGTKYVFKPTAKTIDFSMTPGFVWTTLFAIVNLTAKTSIYAIGIAGYGASISGSVLTLDYDTTAMNANDALMFVMDEGNDSANDLLTLASTSGVAVKASNMEDLMHELLVEARLTNILLANIGNIQDDMDDLRGSITQNDL